MNHNYSCIVKGCYNTQYLSDKPFVQILFETLSEKAGENAAAIIEAETENHITYQNLFNKACALTTTLKKLNYNEHTILALCSENNKEYFIPIIASLFLGSTIAPINSNYKRIELTHALNLCEPKVIFCSKTTTAHILEIKSTINCVESVVIIDSEDETFGAITLNKFIMNSINIEKNYFSSFNPKQKPAILLCSSGTTGLPKAVVITHSNLCAIFWHTCDKRFWYQLDFTLVVLPLFHAYGLILTLSNLAKGSKLIVISRFSDQLLFQTIEKYKIQSFCATPALLTVLAKSSLLTTYNLKSLLELTVGGSSLDKSTTESLKNTLNVQIRQGYGLTETTAIVAVNPIKLSKPGSIGQIVSSEIFCIIRDLETDKSLGCGLVGELCVFGATVVKGYYKNPEAMKDNFTSDGWLRTGDLAYYDEDNYFYIVGRIKNLIKYKSWQISPEELEALLLTHPKIEDAGVIGLPNNEVGELPFAFVVKSKDLDLSNEEVIDYVKQNLSPQKWLRGGVTFISHIPRNSSGKIMRTELKQIWKTLNQNL